jgi:UDP-N-acetylglucosamine 2-epimerase (non-hydrolysing)
MHLLHVVGARPNFMKAAPVLRAFSKLDFEQTLVHTGQHYDASMSEVFFQQLDMPGPDVNLEVGSGSHARQTAEVMVRLEPVVLDRKPDLVMVYGDVNSTLATALVCSKLGIRIVHVEAGLRSGDRAMPEEINRLLTDQLADMLFTPSPDADENLLFEGIEASRIHRIGNVMIDSVVRFLALPVAFPIPDDSYALVTLHRPSNVDDLPFLRQILVTLSELSRDLTIMFPVHPRTRRRIAELGIPAVSNERLHLLDPAPYVEFLHLQRHATVVITDSGGIQEETTFLNIPCLTLRNNTERPITVTHGTNILVGRDVQRLQQEIRRILEGETKERSPIPLWDGHAAERIAHVVSATRQSQPDPCLVPVSG